jgi:hypothetical protein
MLYTNNPFRDPFNIGRMIRPLIDRTWPSIEIILTSCIRSIINRNFNFPLVICDE